MLQSIKLSINWLPRHKKFTAMAKGCVLILFVLSGCNSILPTSSPVPQPSATVILQSTLPPVPTATPHDFLIFPDPFNDARRLPDDVACLPDYLDISRAAIAKMANGGIQIRIDLSATVPTRIEPGNNGFDFSLYLGDDIVRPISQFRVLAAGPRYTALYTMAGSPLQPDPAFTAAFNGSQVIMEIQPSLLEDLPAAVTASLKTFFCPPGSQFCCDDFATPGRSFPLSLR